MSRVVYKLEREEWEDNMMERAAMMKAMWIGV